MVTRSYMLDKPPAPGKARRTLDQVAVPAMIDAAAMVEGLVERLAVSARRAPGTTLLLSCVAGLVLGRAVLGRAVLGRALLGRALLRSR